MIEELLSSPVPVLREFSHSDKSRRLRSLPLSLTGTP
jgi:hypothetical protein